MKEGNLSAPERKPIPWRDVQFWDSADLESELERVFDICHGCRRCVSLCESFPVLFDLVDESDTLEIDGVDKADYSKVVEQCYLCDLCAETKCPYLPPHEWAVDFPHLMLRAKAQKFRQGQTKWRDRLITSSDQVLGLAGKKGVARTVNALNRNATFRRFLQSTAGIHKQAPLPALQTPSARQSFDASLNQNGDVLATSKTQGKVAIFVTCYGNHVHPQSIEDLTRIFAHNGIAVTLLPSERCCGMPKLELGDLEAVNRFKEINMPILMAAIEEGCDLVAPIPSCVLMFKQELPLMYPDDKDVSIVRESFFDPFEYLMLRHKEGLLDTQFRQGLGKVAYHVACHQRVQRIGFKTRDLFRLMPDTEVVTIERCSGHDGTYAWKEETYANAVKISRPTVAQVKKAQADVCMSDCLMAGRMIEHGLGEDARVSHPLSLLRRAYGI